MVATVAPRADARPRLRDDPAYSAASATFSSAVRVGTRLKDWNTKPMVRARIWVRSRSERVVASAPSIRRWGLGSV
jgi:hypothetical protein